MRLYDYVDIEIEDATYIEEKIRDWINRLESLYRQIDTWLKGSPGVRVERAEMLQMEEEMMRRYGVKPQLIPTLKLISKKGYVSFFPVALWVVGSDGRIDINTKNKHLILVDMRDNNTEESNWQVTNIEYKRKGLVSFDKLFFLKLLKEMALSQSEWVMVQ
ncbi:MAG: hypothetical protein HQL05_10605 [Nitrospirae bacterium]|uniref:hypothetical protein n=1 Tax=Candidatus Magnetobacterium casense TaxID=1455061 RepID=UPI00058BE8B4|nr:hypothetical protein [Candidatus Magnetobacterium casensis]MBF0338269.1 hypothetical protein [Nitrospirota bacterium]